MGRREGPAARTAGQRRHAQRLEASVRARLPRGRRLHPSVVGLGALLAIAALSLLYPSSPGYDPWAWIIWGREIAELDLDTEGGPSWKPLPVLFTTVFSFAGDAAPALWLVVARAGALLAVAMAFRLAARLAGSSRILAGVVAALAVLLVGDFVPLAAQGWSEPLLAASLLLAVDRHLHGARRAALVLLFAAALLRPEAWPFLALYGADLWRREPARRRLVALLLLLVPVLWFLPELVGSGDVLRSQGRAQQPLPGRPALAENPAVEVLRQGEELVPGPIEVLAALAVAFAAFDFALRRREGATLLLALASTAWVAIVAVMAEFGFTGNPRYVVPAAVVVGVLAGVGAARGAEGFRVAAERIRRRRIATLAAALAAALALAVLVSAAWPALERVDAGAKRVRSEADVPADLDDAVRLAGGREHVLACGGVFTGSFEVPVVAWTLHVDVHRVTRDPKPPGVVFRLRSQAADPSGAIDVAPEDPFTLVVRTPRWDVLSSCGR